jgi:hypothetical protein
MPKQLSFRMEDEDFYRLKERILKERLTFQEVAEKYFIDYSKGKEVKKKARKNGQ